MPSRAYNATGPAETETVKQMREACRAASTHPASIVWVPEKFLTAQKVTAWDELPVWAGSEGADKEAAGLAAWRAQR